MKTAHKLTAMCMFLLAAACSNPTQNTDDADFKDSVSEALENGGKIDTNAFRWTREPAAYEFKGDTIAITTARTGSRDLWYRFSRRADDFCIECSTNGVDFSQTKNSLSGSLHKLQDIFPDLFLADIVKDFMAHGGIDG